MRGKASEKISGNGGRRQRGPLPEARVARQSHFHGNAGGETTLVFECRVLKQTGNQTMEPDKFYFRMSALPVTTKPGFWARLFGVRPTQKNLKIAQTVATTCPYCLMPIMMTPAHIGKSLCRCP
jgi:hypothetical protein